MSIRALRQAQLVTDNVVIAETQGPDGRTVVLLERIWHHKVLVARPDLADLIDDVLETVRRPEHSASDPVIDRHRFYRRHVGPTLWLLVVVSYEQGPARIITALGTRKNPPTWIS